MNPLAVLARSDVEAAARIAAGNSAVAEELISVLYDELRMDAGELLTGDFWAALAIVSPEAGEAARRYLGETELAYAGRVSEFERRRRCG